MPKMDTILTNLRLQVSRLEDRKSDIEDELGGDWLDDIDTAVDDLELQVSNAIDELDARKEEAEEDEDEE